MRLENEGREEAVLGKIKKMDSGQVLWGLAGHLQEFGFCCNNVLDNVMLIEWEDAGGLKQESVLA